MIDSDPIADLAARLRAAAANPVFASILAEREFAEIEALRRLDLRPHASLLVLGGGKRVLEEARSLQCERIVAANLDRDATATDRGIEWKKIDDALNGSYDGILVIESLTLMPDEIAQARRLRELLRSGGRMVTLFDFYAENTATHPWRRKFDLPFKLHSVPGWARIFTAAGFESCEASRVKAQSNASVSDWRSIRGSLTFVLTVRT